MKTTKRLLSALFAALLTLSLAACDNSNGGNNGGNLDIPASQTAGNDFQKNMHQATKYDVSKVAETNDGTSTSSCPKTVCGGAAWTPGSMRSWRTPPTGWSTALPSSPTTICAC